jgi:hypothetical protein
MVDREELCGALSASDIVLDVDSQLVCNMSIGSWHGLWRYAMCPHQYVRRAYLVARGRGCVCVHAPGSSINGGLRYNLLLREVGYNIGALSLKAGLIFWASWPILLVLLAGALGKFARP